MDLSSFVCSLLRHGPNIMLYPGAFEPKPRSVMLPSSWGLKFENLTLTTEDRVNIHAYLLHQAGSTVQTRKNSSECIPEDELRPTVIMFHGNCDNIGFTLPLAQIFVKRMRCNVLMLSPRGYGLSEGMPSTKGFQKDADAALNYVQSHATLAQCPIVLFGQSMGGSFAIDLGGRHPDKVSAMIIENTFTSLRRLIPDIMPIFSFAAPFFRQWNSLRTMRRLDPRVRLLMLSGAKDEIIPPRHMQELWEAASGSQCPPPTELPTDRAPSSTTPEPNVDSSSNSKGEQTGKPFKWTKLHVGLLARLRLRTHRREESVQSTMVPTEAPSELEVPRAEQTRSSTEKVRLSTARTSSARGNGARKGKFVSIKEGTHNDTWDDPAYWDAIELFLDGVVAAALSSSRPSSSDSSSTPPSFASQGKSGGTVLKASEPEASTRPSADSGEETAVPDSAVEMPKEVELLVKDGDKTWVERVVADDGESGDAPVVIEGESDSKHKQGKDGATPKAEEESMEKP